MTMMEDLPLLRIIALKGRVGPDQVAASLGVDLALAVESTARLAASGLVKEVGAGLRITPEGREASAALLAEERAGVDRAQMQAWYSDFCLLNAPAKGLFTRWQQRDGAPNDHADAEYDAVVLRELMDIHVAVVPLLQAIGASAPRIERYAVRLAEAVSRITSGDHVWVTRPIIDSYHTVWFELHEDLISLAGLTRADEAAAGRAH
jgi:pyruvate,orthophosphate dikinase